MAESKRVSAVPALAAIGGTIVAMSCCLPLGTLLAAAGLAGASTLFASLRPYLMMLAVAALAFGFFQSYRATRCSVRRSPFSMILLWTATLIVAVMIFFPDRIAALLAGP